MAVPKKRRSKSKKRIHRACWKVKLPAMRPCPKCGILGISHRACTDCGTYKGRQVIAIKEKESKKEK
ncbi:50S ribosomal protein L32 [bacterium]|jgi:large subunit ribosomal protein L32|nr:50S ribosomal protein L32 [bacterium]MBT6120500.1 50S ribosomal protein L32 [bacterium]